MSTTSVVHTETTTGMTIQPITVPVSLENKPSGVSPNLILLGLVVAVMIVGSAAYVRRRRKVPRP
ncbi:MAG: LPXTG cell wall anchor domain-containing protein [Candidatus Bathyarchaeia archaeon]